MYLSGPKLTRAAMRQRSFVISAAMVAALIFGAVGAWAYDSAHDQQIAKGVKAGGVNIGGLSTKAAQRKLRAKLGPRLVRTLTAAYQGQRFDLDPGRARLRVNVKAMVNNALEKSRGGNIISRTLRGLFGGTVRAHVPASVSYDHAAVDAFVKQVAGGVNRSPRDATIGVSLGQLHKVDSQDGRVVRENDLRRKVESALTKTRQNREVTVPIDVTHPKVTMLRGSRVEIAADRAFDVYADGERSVPLPAVFESLPGVLKVAVPPGTCPTARGRAAWPAR